ncbi:hypothetical protein ARMA_2717 [Ardenticatena maritima]|uniref:Uncharacterized protein n=1 Tax=Ardenticatena maritima TaxID=872965 RepID=A0A0M8K958_9CHLR|nr:hypothetical protein ARMA_2717 [Ardenticatena maritima]
MWWALRMVSWMDRNAQMRTPTQTEVSTQAQHQRMRQMVV